MILSEHQRCTRDTHAPCPALSSGESLNTLRACSVVSGSLRPHGLLPARLLCPKDFPGKNTGVGCHFLIQGTFLTQRSNPHLSSPALAGRFFTPSSTSITWEAEHYKTYKVHNSISKRHPTYPPCVKNSYNSATKTNQFFKMGQRWYFLGDPVAKDSVLPIQGPGQWFQPLV